MGRCSLQTVEYEPAFPHPNDIVVRLTDGRQWCVDKRSIPRYNVEHLADTPVFSPDMLDFTIEEEQPVVYLVADDRPGREEVSETLLISAMGRRVYHEDQHGDLWNGVFVRHSNAYSGEGTYCEGTARPNKFSVTGAG